LPSSWRVVEKKLSYGQPLFPFFFYEALCALSNGKSNEKQYLSYTLETTGKKFWWDLAMGTEYIWTIIDHCPSLSAFFYCTMFRVVWFG